MPRADSSQTVVSGLSMPFAAIVLTAAAIMPRAVSRLPGWVDSASADACCSRTLTPWAAPVAPARSELRTAASLQRTALAQAVLLSHAASPVHVKETDERVDGAG